MKMKPLSLRQRAIKSASRFAKGLGPYGAYVKGWLSGVQAGRQLGRRDKFAFAEDCRKQMRLAEANERRSYLEMGRTFARIKHGRRSTATRLAMLRVANKNLVRKLAVYERLDLNDKRAECVRLDQVTRQLAHDLYVLGRAVAAKGVDPHSVIAIEHARQLAEVDL